MGARNKSREYRRSVGRWPLAIGSRISTPWSLVLEGSVMRISYLILPTTESRQPTTLLSALPNDQ